MSEHYDRYETRPQKSRESALLRDLKAIVSVAKPRAAGLRKQIRGINIAEIKRREDLARIPVLRKPDLHQMQADEPPFGGLVATRASGLRHVLIDCVEGQARDWWGAARALCAAGFRRGDLILNCFSYHLSSTGHIIDSGAAALGCAVIPAGQSRIERQLEAIHALKPQGYCGKPAFLKQLLDRATEVNCDVSSITRALVFGAPLDAQLRQDIEARGIHLRQAYATSDLGIIAYETDTPEGGLNAGMVLNENLILEIVKPGTDIPVAAGEVGEVVVTRLNLDYPLLRFATGDLSMMLPGASPCGRTNLRIRGWMGRVEDAAQVDEKLLLPAHVMQIADRHECLSRLRMTIMRDHTRDRVLLHAETSNADTSLHARLGASVQAVTGMGAEIEIVAPGTLPSDGKLIVDERTKA
jgi:phenylacetate-CoA ligase